MRCRGGEWGQRHGAADYPNSQHGVHERRTVTMATCKRALRARYQHGNVDDDDDAGLAHGWIVSDQRSPAHFTHLGKAEKKKQNAKVRVFTRHQSLY